MPVLAFLASLLNEPAALSQTTSRKKEVNEKQVHHPQP